MKTLVRIMLLAAFASLPARADPPHWHVDTVAHDERAGLLVLEVDRFPAEGPAQLRIEGHEAPLAIVSRSRGWLVARLPRDLPWARHVLRLERTREPDDFALAELLLGPVGPPVSEH